MPYFPASDVRDGIKSNEFSNLSPSAQKKLLRLIARISEVSYRRGFQHGHLFASKDVKTRDPHALRHRISHDLSPYTDGFGGHSAIERVQMEYELWRVGLGSPSETKEQEAATQKKLSAVSSPARFKKHKQIMDTLQSVLDETTKK